MRCWSLALVGLAACTSEVDATELTFTKEATWPEQMLEDAWSFGDGEAYVVGTNGTVVRRTKAGEWVEESMGEKADLHAIWAASPTEIFVAGNTRVVDHNSGPAMGVILRSSGAGEWLHEWLPLDIKEVGSLWGVSGDEVYATATNTEGLHQVLRSGANGWTVLSEAPSVGGLWAGGPGDVYLTDSGAVHHLVAGEWVKETTPSGLPLGVCGSSSAEVFVFDKSGVAARKRDGGAWVEEDAGVEFPRACHFANPGEVVLFGGAADGTGRVAFAGGTPYAFEEPLLGGAASPHDVIVITLAGFQSNIHRAVF
jgi:hypothetical protein